MQKCSLNVCTQKYANLIFRPIQLKRFSKIISDCNHLTLLLLRTKCTVIMDLQSSSIFLHTEEGIAIHDFFLVVRCEHVLPYINRTLHFQLPYFNICPTVLKLPYFLIALLSIALQKFWPKIHVIFLTNLAGFCPTFKMPVF